MKVRVTIERTSEKKEISFKAGACVTDLLKKLRMNPQEIIAVKNEVVVTEEAELKDCDRVRLLAVISGG